MKRNFLIKYYDFLMWLETIFGGLSTAVNNHRKKIDEKYWDEYINPLNVEK